MQQPKSDLFPPSYLHYLTAPAPPDDSKRWNSITVRCKQERNAQLLNSLLLQYLCQPPLDLLQLLIEIIRIIIILRIFFQSLVRTEHG